MQNSWNNIFEQLKKFNGEDLEFIKSIASRSGAEESLHIELKRCIEGFLLNPQKEQNSHHIAHVAVLLAHLNSEKSSSYLLELVKFDLDYYHYFFDEVTAGSLYFICYKLGNTHLKELLEVVKDDSIYEYGRNYIVEGLLMHCQTNTEIKNIILPEIKLLLNSNIMNFHVIRGALRYKIEDLHCNALKCFNKSKIDPMDLSLDEVNALKDGDFEYSGLRTLDDFYEVLSKYEKQRKEYSHEIDEWDFF